jgi:hypothetical protein
MRLFRNLGVARRNGMLDVLRVRLRGHPEGALTLRKNRISQVSGVVQAVSILNILSIPVKLRFS